MSKVLIEEMTRDETARAFKETDLAIIPIGATEQHGHHLPLGTDSIIAAEMSKRVARRVKAVVTPTVWFGDSPYHMPWAGTITIKPETIIQLLKEICQCLAHHGIKKVLIINGHMGNASILLTAASVIETEVGLRVAVCDYIHVTDEISKQITGREVPSISTNPVAAYDDWQGHAAGKETDGVLAVRPDLVYLNEAREPSPAKDVVEKTRAKGLSTHLGKDLREFAPTGWWGSVKGVNKEEAERMYDLTADKIVERIKRVLG